jgi:hypothetical protein
LSLLAAIRWDVSQSRRAGIGRRDLRRQQLKRQNPGRGGVPGYRYRAILGDQDGGCHRPGGTPP